MIWSKLKEIRDLKGYSQGEMSELSGIIQKDISLLEAGKKKFIPQEYIQFLYKLGVDINSLYDDDAILQWRKIDLYTKNTSDTPVVNERSGAQNHIDSSHSPTVESEKKPNLDNNASPTHPENASPSASPTRNLGLPFVITMDNAGRENVTMVPVRARAGYLTGYGDPEFIQTLPTYTIPGLRNGTFRAFEVEGNSMAPTLNKNDIVIGDWVESLDDIRDDRVHIIVTKNDGIVVKRVLNRINEYGFLVCKSDSVTNRSEYPNINVAPEDILEIWYSRMYLSANFKSPSDLYQRINDLEAGFEYLKSKL